MCRDLVFSAQTVGQGLDLEVERFKRLQDEENMRHVMGKSAWRLALDLWDMVKVGDHYRCGLSDADLLAKLLSKRKELAKDWKSDTCGRYLSVANKIDSNGKAILTRWELVFLRGTLVDGITALQSATTASATSEDMSVLLETLFYEQACKLRKSIAAKGRSHTADITNTFRGILLRQALFKYLRQIFPKLEEAIENYGRWEWFNETFKVTRTGQLPESSPAEEDGEGDAAEDLCSRQDEPSRFESKVKLLRFCDHLARGRHDFALAALGKEQGGASNLDLSRECMRTVKARIQEIWSDYVADFPQQQQEPMSATQVPSMQVDTGIDGHGTTVRASSHIESEEEYNTRKAAWLSQCEKATEESVEQYIPSMIVLVASAYETTSIEQKL